MFFKKRPVIDITRKTVPTWWGGRKVVPTSRAEQRRLKAEIRKHDPKAVILDSEAKGDGLDWIDRLEEFEAFME